MSSSELIAVHGWTAVPRDPKVFLEGKEYLHAPAPLLVQDMDFPRDDPLVAKVQNYAKEHLLEQTFNHSMRVYYFG